MMNGSDRPVVIAGNTILRGIADSGFQSLTQEDLRGAIVLPAEFLDRVISACGTIEKAIHWLNTRNPRGYDLAPLEIAIRGSVEGVYRLLSECPTAAGGECSLPLTSAGSAVRTREERLSDLSLKVRAKLSELQPPEDREPRRSVQVLLPKKAHQVFVAIQHWSNVRPSAFFTAAAVSFVREFERSCGELIPTAPISLQDIPKDAAERLIRPVLELRDTLHFDRGRTQSGQIPSGLDAKISRSVFIFDHLGFRTSKRAVLGFEMTLLLDELLQATGFQLPDERNEGADVGNE